MSRLGGQGKTLLAVTLAVTVYSINQGLSYPLLSVLLEKRGASSFEIGLSAAMTPLGIIMSSGWVNSLSRRLGRGTLLIVSVAGTCTCLLLLGVLDPALWLPVRFLLGGFINAFYIAAETAVNQFAPSVSRGRVIAGYTALTTLGYAVGPLLLAAIGSDGAAPFVLIAMLLAVALVIAWVPRPTVDAAAVSGEATDTIRAFVRRAPVLVMANAAAAFFDTAAVTLLPVYGLQVGLGESAAVLGLTVLLLGGVLLQYPAGVLSDLVQPHRLMFGAALASAAGGGLVLLAGSDRMLFYGSCFLLGAAVLALQMAALHELGERFAGGALAAGNAAFALTWGIVSAAGIPLAGLSMDGFGASGALILPIAFFAATAALLLRYARTRTRGSPVHAAPVGGRGLAREASGRAD